MVDEQPFDAGRAAYDAAAAARGRAMTAFEEHLADAVMNLAQAVGQLDAKLDALRAAPRDVDES